MRDDPDGVLRDDWGVPHLVARDPDDLAHLQGVVTARDRAWQLEVERHRAQGTTAAFLGPAALDWDRFARRARLADTAKRCLRALDPGTARWLGRYVAGVNAGLAEGARTAPEFDIVGVRPGRWRTWTPLAVWLSHHILFAAFPAKLWRTEASRLLGAAGVEVLAADAPGTAGSNGWLVTSEHTATGSALLAGDPHRYAEDPGMYQQIGLACPDYDVVGFAVPGVPGIPHFGHTGGVAWAITNAMADCQDLYAERLRRRGSGVEALGPRGWRPAPAHREALRVAGGPDEFVEVVETARGPVVVGGPDEPVALSLRYPPRALADAGFAALPALLAARTVADVDRALDRWVEPVNVVLAADIAGGTLHRVAGAVPDRDETNGWRVVPADDPRYAWQGWRPLPRSEVGGVAVMANERGLAAPLGVEFAAPHRHRRITELLGRAGDWTAEELGVVHHDTLLATAAPLIALAADLPGLGAEATSLVRRLAAWDRRMEVDSRVAVEFADVRSEVVRGLVAHPALRALAVPLPYPEVFQPWLDPVPRTAYALTSVLAGGLLDGRDLIAILRDAVDSVATTAAPPGLTWGDRHRFAPWRALPDRCATPAQGVGGDHDCVLATSSVPGSTHAFTRAPVARFVWDLARREDSHWVVPFGAAGRTDHPHHHDQFPLWARGDLVRVGDPLARSRPSE
ncbi:penicillin acylase family protein [Actinoalloteichus caeruleus]|uniref:penicillin acylase family protein n=1 Tax=Actinoalloteichus cyanogriseus TaxID=2893586 RepID=UPI000B194A47|nr:penicillin acylase family protein [Actinoalloteichus caeruleus]